MPDPASLIKALGAAVVTAAAFLVLLNGPWWGAASRGRWLAGWLFALAAGSYLGCYLLGLWPHWPPREDLDRFLVLVFPAALAMEFLAFLPSRLQWLAWAGRLGVVAGTARALLHDSVYLVDLAGPSTRQWSVMQAVLILGTLAGALAAQWALLHLLQRRNPDCSVHIVIAMSCAGAGVTVMLSSYLTGGELGLLLSATLMGCTAAAWALPGPDRTIGPLGTGLVALFGLLVMGRFFGELTTTHALLLFFAPLLSLVSTLPGVRRLRPFSLGLLRVLLVAVVLAAVVDGAYRKFVEDFSSSSIETEPSLQN